LFAKSRGAKGIAKAKVRTANSDSGGWVDGGNYEVLNRAPDSSYELIMSLDQYKNTTDFFFYSPEGYKPLEGFEDLTGNVDGGIWWVRPYYHDDTYRFSLGSGKFGRGIYPPTKVLCVDASIKPNSRPIKLQDFFTRRN
jgi:hypothetical protein